MGLFRGPVPWFLPPPNNARKGASPMERRAVLRRSALAATAAAPLAAPAIVHAQAPAIRWRLTSSYPTSLDAINGAAHVFSKTVAELTDDRFQIRVFRPGEGVPALRALDAVQAGTVEACHTTCSNYIGKNPAF